MQAIIPILLSALALSTLLNVALRRFNIPTAVGYIAAGTVLAAALGIEIEADGPLGSIAEFGIVFLMFTIGLEFSLSQLRQMRREVFLFGFLQVFLTAAVIAAAAAALFALAPMNAAIVGSALALSSTAIVLKILNESGKIKSEEGRNSVGILIFQDLAVIPILLLIALVTDRDSSLVSLLSSMAANAAILLAVIFVSGHFLLKWFFRVVSETNSKEIYIGSILLTAVGASWLAHHFGFSYSLGGFLAGMMIADTIYKHQVEADLIPFRDLLLGVFFVSVGLQIDLGVVTANLSAIVLLCLGLMAIKAAVLFLILLPFNSRVVTLKTAVNLAQIGEFALVVLSLMLGNRLMPPDQVQILMVTVVLSMVATPFAINNTDALMRLAFKYGPETGPAASLSLVSGHVVLLGFGHLGQIIARQLEAGAYRACRGDRRDRRIRQGARARPDGGVRRSGRPGAAAQGRHRQGDDHDHRARGYRRGQARERGDHPDRPGDQRDRAGFDRSGQVRNRELRPRTGARRQHRHRQPDRRADPALTPAGARSLRKSATCAISTRPTSTAPSP